MGKTELSKEYGAIAWPAAMEGLLLMLLASMDLIMIGRMGTVAVSAVGIFDQPRMVTLCFCRSFAVAVTVLVARKVGEKDYEALSGCLKQSLVCMAVVASILLVLSLIFVKDILLLAGASTEYLSDAVIYSQICMVGLFFSSFAVIIHGAFAGMGKTRVMMVTNVTGNLVNILLNAILIPHFGVKGAAIGTLCGNIATLLLTVSVVVNKHAYLTLWGKKDWKPTKVNLEFLYPNSLSSFAEQGFERVGMLLYAGMVARLGTVAYATHIICMKICDIFYQFCMGMGKANMVFAGQGVGAKDDEKIVTGVKYGQKIGFILSVIAFFLYLTLRTPLMWLFSRDPQVVELGKNILLFVAVCSFPQCHAQICSGTIRGIGKIQYVVKYSFFSITVARPIVTYVLCFVLGWGLYGAWTALLIDQATRMICAEIGKRKYVYAKNK